ncbi:HTH DNA binding protein [Gordonia phage Sour]|uniref:Helix-turn-helix DNA binding protein n=1 Tax=Gordonia phage Sour TaxID=2182349 RepID=A0A2U8UKL9_9CAUD|nr:HTH DNA binding protein [Gordonia phage Sour]AWN04245.1 helix-turn-helix DNA binding protein [Gordonia phage Sour]
MSTPTGYEHGLGLTILAHRRYLGLSQFEMADALKMNPHSYKRIETDRRPCPPGLLDNVVGLVAEFDRALDAVLDEWASIHPGDRITMSATDTPLHRAALMRAAVEFGGTTPIIIGDDNTEVRAG